MWDSLIAYILLVWYCILLGIGLLGWREARKRYKLRKLVPAPPRNMANVEGVSILRPLRGLDPNMYENLETSFRQNYPKFEIIFAVADEGDPCLKIVQELIDKYPHVDARIDIGEDNVGVNPKINNLMGPYRTAKYDMLWVIDSNVQVVSDTLARSVDSFHSIPSTSTKPRVGIVHHVPYAMSSDRDSAAIGTQLESAFLNTNHAKMYIALNVLAVDSCIMGKSNLFRRSDVEKINASGIPLDKQHDPSGVRGLASVAKFAGEDAMIGYAIWHELNLTHILSSDVAANALGPMSLKAYIARRARWIRVRKGTVMAATFLEPFTESVFMGLLASFALSYVTDGATSMWAAFLLHWAIFLSIDLDVRYVLTEDPFETWNETFKFILAWMGREVLAFPIWLYAVVGNKIDWRGEKYRMLRGGEVERVDNRKKAGMLGKLTEGVLGGRPRGSYEPLLSNNP